MLNTYLNQLNKSPNTKLAIRRDVGAFLREHDPLRASAEDVRRFFAREAERGLGPKALHERYRHLREFFAWVVAAGLRRDNPMENIPEPHVQGSLKAILRMRNQAIAALLHQGIPANTLASLTLQDVARYKNNAVLARYLERRHHLHPATDRVFVTQRGLPMTPSAIYWAGGRVVPARMGAARITPEEEGYFSST